ncbi:ABC transporter ATP-binding protein [Arsenicitalea aurantiaca]|uniref:ABC transporter ATP-binding protein n=1 Tax=Arsenicitalea aurantiaca TaxID=1783274 RepID=A0A433XBD7_9HYPH|nr:ABC transporter ATP-binding protein [Arsenicitalea aurantiaca]RUT31411.1 ABC transporter ATP-binding protein [Arsenicitalea aurantiaca]
MKTRSAGAHLAIEAVTKTYGKAKALDAVSLVIEPGELLALLGPSGCGKTTLLKIIAGLIDPDEGEVLVDGLGMVRLPTHRRDMGMLFQNYALFPHLDVISNVAFGLEMRRLPRAEIEERARRALDRVQLSAYSGRMPRELSGGQQQRVALARAIAYEPKILLLDEPLAALDKNLREGMQMELRALCKQLELTTVLVTHDQEEAMTMADRIAVMRAGRLEQLGSARAVYERPENRFVAGFIGTSNFFPFAGERSTGALGATIPGRTPGGDALLAIARDGTLPEGGAMVAVRPEHVALSVSRPAAEANAMVGRLTQILFRGAHMTAVLRTDGGQEIVASAPADALPPGLAEGDAAWAHWKAEHALIIEDK